MNPVVKPVADNLVAYQLTDEDRKRLDEIQLIHGGGQTKDAVFHRMCIMQAVSMLTHQASLPVPDQTRFKAIKRKIAAINRKISLGYTHALVTERGKLLNEINGRAYTDQPICVSKAITRAMIELNDRRLNKAQRAQLKELVEDILNTCPVSRKELKTKTVERPTSTPEYRAVEKERRKMLEPIFAGGRKRASLEEGMALVRQAAALYKTDEGVK